MIGMTELRLMPNMKADMYLGGRIPANPAIDEFRMAMQMPKAIIMATDIWKEREGEGEKWTKIGRTRKRVP